MTITSTGIGGPTGEGVGSGFVVSPSGEIATNAHVVTSGTGAAIRPAGEVFVGFADHNQVPARIVGFDPFTDVALLKIDPAALHLHPLELGSSRDLRVGAPVVAIGSPFGEDRSLSAGIISATGRSIQSLTGFATTGAIQTDAAVNQGNSGGPLLDADGRVVGINSQIESPSGAGSGVGFAVPVDAVRRSLHQLRTQRAPEVRLPRPRDGAGVPAARAPVRPEDDLRRLGPDGDPGRPGRGGGAAGRQRHRALPGARLRARGRRDRRDRRNAGARRGGPVEDHRLAEAGRQGEGERRAQRNAEDDRRHARRSAARKPARRLVVLLGMSGR